MEPIQPIPPTPIPTTQPEVPDELHLKEWMLQLLEEELTLSEEDKVEIRQKVADFLNKIIDIPWIGEKLEQKLFNFAVKAFSKVGEHYGKKLLNWIF